MRFSRNYRTDYALLVVAILLSLVLPWYPVVRSQGTPPVDVVYSESGLTYQNGLYFDKIALRNRSSETVIVVAVVKTRFDYSARRSSPTTICGGCTVTVLIKEVQPLATQTPEQRQYMIEGMTHPDYIRVEYASGSSTPLDSTLAYGVTVTGIVALIAFLYYLAKHRKRDDVDTALRRMMRSGNAYVDQDLHERMQEDTRTGPRNITVAGEPLQKKACGKCGNMMPANYAFCDKCGARTLSEAELEKWREYNRRLEHLRTVEPAVPASKAAMEPKQETKPSRESARSVSTKFCRYCGAKIPRQSKFCEECGKALAEKRDGA
jgi:RNA polymerase subunit RPABC4/transcription elongation factor Spt4